MIAEAFFIGLIVAFIYYELTGLTPGGVIAPAYLALYVYDPLNILATLLAATLTWGTLKLLIPWLLIYGRRKLLLALVIGFAYGLILNRLLGIGAYLPNAVHSIGYLIPGLVASEMVRQKVLPTLASLGIVMSLVYLILLAFHG